MTIDLKQARAAAHRRDIISLIEIIERDIEFISMDDVVEMSGYPRRILQDLFLKYVGFSISTYIRRRRLALVYSELTKGKCNDSILDIAARFGIYCGPTFFRWFREEFNLTPRDVVSGLTVNTDLIQQQLVHSDLK